MKNYKLMEFLCQWDIPISFIKMFINYGYDYDYETFKEHFEIRVNKPTVDELKELEELQTLLRRRPFLLCC